MGILERRLRQKEEVRTSILQAAWQLVLEEGWQALSIRKIADAIEYSVPVIYTHFENKDAILQEFTRDGFKLLTEDIIRQRDSQVDPSHQLEAIAQGYWDFAFAHKEYYQLMFGLGIPACEQVNQVAEMKQFSNVLISVIQTAISTSNKPQVDAFLKFHTYWSILHGLVSIQMIDSQSIINPWSQLVLKDAIDGFIKALEG
ncbi:TetR/AcrR family transcriptional regulator [Spirosoma utsteinense]|uniref:AcrR family transcriptional regulator n=1 Tax=Spirosoma utsteinense TaxID=2585773 RepID=A0ABR6W2D7_9BACT|nr:TetR/AcrR family transcriptional regulator [Spirosoma utsteinense]MBC3785073.1 AcrR family transcriptional regulator [Spirosoma utsteinense]MBC3790318.1 AcrR family transcriptional regulator [Spirosoma utsteinense]